MTWAEEEFGGADLGDKRLNKRLAVLAERLGEQPSASIPEACRGLAEMHAAYRYPVVLCIQDTTELDLEGKSTRGLGPLSYEAQRGMYVHPTYGVTPAREPLGEIHVWMWARAFKQGEAPREGIAESMRWIEAYAQIAEQAQHMPDTRLMYLTDREADIAAWMRRARNLGTPADWLILSQHDLLLGKGTEAKRGAGSSAVPDGLTPKPSCAYGAPRNTRAAPSLAQWRGRHGERGAGERSRCAERRQTVRRRFLSIRQAATLDKAVTLIEWYRASGKLNFSSTR